MLKEAEEKFDIKREIFQWVQSLLVSVIAVGILFTFVGRPAPVDGISMEPTFQDGDLVITSPVYGELKRGDVVAIKRKRDTSLIKRVIAIEGDVIDINFRKGEVYVNDELLDEPYIAEPTTRSLGMDFPVTVPEGCVFVMGDNRNHSDDSRNPTIGMIDTRNVFGKVCFRVFPFKSFGFIK